MFTARRLCVAVDLAGFSARTPEGQARAQRRLLELLDRAWQDAGQVATENVRELRGDAEVAIASPDVDEGYFVSAFL